MIPQQIIDKMEDAEKRFYYSHERFIRYGKGYDKRNTKIAIKEMNSSLNALRKIYILIYELDKTNERAK